MIRIIAGEFKGRRLKTPASVKVRPTADRVGMFWRFGLLDDSRPVAAPAWLTQARLTAFFPGWTLGDPTDCLVPEPAESCAMLSCGGMLMLGFFRLRRKAGLPQHALAA